MCRAGYFTMLNNLVALEEQKDPSFVDTTGDSPYHPVAFTSILSGGA